MTAHPKTSFSVLLQTFFTDRLMHQQQASPHTITSYRDTFCLLLRFASRRLGKGPSSLSLPDIDAPLVVAFLDYLEADRAARGGHRPGPWPSRSVPREGTQDALHAAETGDGTRPASVASRAWR